MKRLFILILLFTAITAHAQRFFNLTSDEVRVDSVMPFFSSARSISGISPSVSKRAPCVNSIRPVSFVV